MSEEPDTLSEKDARRLNKFLRAMAEICQGGTNIAVYLVEEFPEEGDDALTTSRYLGRMESDGYVYSCGVVQTKNKEAMRQVRTAFKEVGFGAHDNGEHTRKWTTAMGRRVVYQGS